MADVADVVDVVDVVGTLPQYHDLHANQEFPNLHLDRGYDSAKSRDLLDVLGFTPHIAVRSRPAPIQAGRRWPVERLPAADVQVIADPVDPGRHSASMIQELEDPPKDFLQPQPSQRPRRHSSDTRDRHRLIRLAKAQWSRRTDADQRLRRYQSAIEQGSIPRRWSRRRT